MYVYKYRHNYRTILLKWNGCGEINHLKKGMRVLQRTIITQIFGEKQI